MIKHIPFLVLLSTLCAATHGSSDAPGFTPSGGSEITLMSYNIRNGKAADGINNWEKRKHRVVAMIESVKPELLGLQEVYPFQRDFLLENLSGFASVGIGRNGEDSESVSILVSKSRFRILDSGTFWLSDTPAEKSITWSWLAYLHRICTWVYLEDKKTEETFYFFNTHYDHFSSRARALSSKLMLEKIAKRKTGRPFILGGDFNAQSDELAITTLLNNSEPALADSFEYYENAEQAVGTFNGFEKDNFERIDYLFTSKELLLKRMDIHKQKIEGYFPSDHFPISIKFSFL
ncbi:MAG: endonuclease/exonuclease/phosphatase family protein [Halieaceae bacterium]|jgi:endonuclease/exonuclease/phosphatase family metal-dependent hydrolase|nr:endonuclease/exonuclease/phosphatase family protein [Halieaceae bacterium]